METLYFENKNIKRFYSDHLQSAIVQSWKNCFQSGIFSYAEIEMLFSRRLLAIIHSAELEKKSNFENINLNNWKKCIFIQTTCSHPQCRVGKTIFRAKGIFTQPVLEKLSFFQLWQSWSTLKVKMQSNYSSNQLQPQRQARQD